MFRHKRRARTQPLSNKEKRKLVEAELKKDPARSDVEIAKVTGATHCWRDQRGVQFGHPGFRTQVCEVARRAGATVLPTDRHLAVEPPSRAPNNPEQPANPG